MNKLLSLERSRFDGQSYWYTVRVGEWLALARVFAIPSKFGIGARDNEGEYLCDPTALPASARISSLTITDTSECWGKPHAVYNYDRGLDYDLAPAGLLNTVIAAVLKFAKR